MMRLPKLDERLLKAANMFPACAYGADIGADHGRLSCYLLANKCERMFVSDLSAPSLEKAKRLLRLHGFADRADFCVCDGLNGLEQQADAIAILGMGGKTIAQILQSGKETRQGATLIVSAHTELGILRHCISAIGYHIDEEQIAHAGGRYYIIIRALPGERSYTEKEMLIGPYLMEKGGEHFMDYLAWRRDVLKCENTEQGRRHLDMILEVMQDAGDGK